MPRSHGFRPRPSHRPRPRHHPRRIGSGRRHRRRPHRGSGFGPVAVTSRCGTQSSTWTKPSNVAPLEHADVVERAAVELHMGEVLEQHVVRLAVCALELLPGQGRVMLVGEGVDLLTDDDPQMFEAHPVDALVNGPPSGPGRRTTLNREASLGEPATRTHGDPLAASGRRGKGTRVQRHRKTSQTDSRAWSRWRQSVCTRPLSSARRAQAFAPGTEIRR
jgi:hypothetical protein